MSQSRDAQAASSESVRESADLLALENDLTDISIRDLIQSYLSHNPEPEDEQIHHLAELIGIPFEEFEAEIYSMFGDAVGDSADDIDSEDPDDVAEDLTGGDDEDVDSLDMFLISFFLRNPDPSDEQIHTLARLVGMTPEALEEHLYSLLAQFVDDEDDDYEDDSSQ